MTCVCFFVGVLLVIGVVVAMRLLDLTRFSGGVAKTLGVFCSMFTLALLVRGCFYKAFARCFSGVAECLLDVARHLPCFVRC